VTDERTVLVPARGRALEGDLRIPDGARAIVLFAHGSRISRQSPRNQYVAGVFGQIGLATLLMDLLTPSEERFDAATGRLRFDIGLLAERLISATDWLGDDPGTRDLRIGYFGASIGTGAALVAAAERPARVGAIVSRGGRPDLAGEALSLVKAPTLLIVAGEDAPVIAVNRDALGQLRVQARIEIVPGATHLFEERGALAQVANLARLWFSRYLEARFGCAVPRTS
jgi:putative phosphoribosyl transferase